MNYIKWLILAEIIKRWIQLLALGILVNATLATILPASIGLIALIDSVGVAGFLGGSLLTGYITEFAYTSSKFLIRQGKRISDTLIAHRKEIRHEP